jgi:hypothetical protein
MYRPDDQYIIIFHWLQNGLCIRKSVVRFRGWESTLSASHLACETISTVQLTMEMEAYRGTSTGRKTAREARSPGTVMFLTTGPTAGTPADL